jgi:Cu/Ag efflux protein CusF
MRRVMLIAGLLVAPGAAAWADAPRVAQATGTAPKAMPGKVVADSVKVRGTIDAIDKEKGTITLKGPQGRTVTLEVRDRAKLDAVKVGDPVVATYVEAVAFQVRKAGTAAPGATVKETQVGSKPGETPAGAVGREITVTATITALDTKARTVTIKGPLGSTETFKIKDPKNAEGVKVGDLVEITYTQALAVALDKPAN